MLFIDICGSTEMTERLGDDRAIALLHEHDGIVRDGLTLHDGREVKHTGDGIMARSARCRVQSTAIAMEQRLACAGDVSPDARLAFASGSAREEPRSDHDPVAPPSTRGSALLELEPTRHLRVGGSARAVRRQKVPLRPRGPMALKGFSEPTHVYEVHWQ